MFNVFAPNIVHPSGRTLICGGVRARDAAEAAVRYQPVAPFCWAEPDPPEKLERGYFVTWEHERPPAPVRRIRATHKLTDLTRMEAVAWMRYIVAQGWVKSATVRSPKSIIVAFLSN